MTITYMISVEDNERAGCDTVTFDNCAFNMPGSMDDAVTRTVSVEVSPCDADITMEVIRDGGAPGSGNELCSGDGFSLEIEITNNAGFASAYVLEVSSKAEGEPAIAVSGLPEIQAERLQ